MLFSMYHEPNELEAMEGEDNVDINRSNIAPTRPSAMGPGLEACPRDRDRGLQMDWNGLQLNSQTSLINQELTDYPAMKPLASESVGKSVGKSFQ